MSKPTKPWKKPYSSDVVPGKKFKRNYPRQKDNKYKQNTDVHTKKIDSQMPLQELKDSKPRKEKVKYSGQDDKSNLWTNGGFKDFDTYLDHSQFSANDWYPWNTMDEKKNKMEPIEIIQEKEETKQSRYPVNSSKPSKPRKVLNLNSLDKATVYRICKKTKSRDVSTLCREYSMNNAREVQREVLKKKNYKAKDMKTRRKKTNKKQHPTKKLTKPKSKKHLFFEPNSFRRRQSERSVSLLDQLASVSRLIWPVPTRRKSDISSASNKVKNNKRGWLGDAMNNYSRRTGWPWQ